MTSVNVIPAVTRNPASDQTPEITRNDTSIQTRENNSENKVRADSKLRTVSFHEAIAATGGNPLRRAPLTQLQINVGRLCNQACEHCHVEAGPKRTEIMSEMVATRIVSWARENNIQSVDFTGGAPEMNPSFRTMVDAFSDMGASIIVRCNLTVLFEPGQQDTAEFFAERGINVVCSLPCYTRDNVEAQRGKGVFDKSIRGLQKLNEVGYGRDEDKQLDLVYNPGGAFLPPAQNELDGDYRERLMEDFGIRYNNLLTLANLPINRFKHYLARTEQLEDYQQLLLDNFNPETVPALMCRHLLSVDWLGRTFDCDFNQMLDMPLSGETSHRFIWDIDAAELTNQDIAVDSHCFGCTAGSGSSCGGALT